MFDTHCHLNFKVFEGKIDSVINEAKSVGVNYFVVPGTDEETSKKAVEIAEKFEGVFAAVGIHPHHIFEIYKSSFNAPFFTPLGHPKSLKTGNFAYLLNSKKVVAIGEVGIDRHYYQQTKYEKYQIDEKFIELQKDFLKAQIELALEYKKSLILHNREAENDLLAVLKSYQLRANSPIVFHCCEPDIELLEFAKEHKIYIGVDGDVTYDEKKQEFVKKIPLDLLVLETDSPFLKPQGQKFPNEPKNLSMIAEFIANLLNIKTEKLKEITESNALSLFNKK